MSSSSPADYLPPSKYRETITITFGDQGENHLGMQIIGRAAPRGLTVAELRQAQAKFNQMGLQTELIDLTVLLPGVELPEAAVLVVRKGAEAILGQSSDALFRELRALPVDTKAKMRGQVKNKIARHNLCFDDDAQEPDYEAGKGRIVAYHDVPLTSAIRDRLPQFFGPLTKGLIAEGNYYYDYTQCGISWHGDAERRLVVAFRVGHSLPLHYQWYHQRGRVGDRARIVLHHGDLYAMSDKAVGTDWKRPSIYTLRHAAGCPQYLA